MKAWIFASAASLSLIRSLPFVGREKVVGVDLVELGVHAIDTPDALNQARGIPRNVVIDDDVGAVKVHAFGKDFGGDQDAIVVLRVEMPWRRSWR